VDEIGFVYVPQACQLSSAAADADGAGAAGSASEAGAGGFIDKAAVGDAGAVDGVGAPTAPAALFAAKCRMHVHYHPCGGSFRDVSTSYMLQNALPMYAESNEMVILYPQVGDASLCCADVSIFVPFEVL
jgi:hypothetical protein